MKSIPRYGRGSARALPTHRDHGLEIIFLEKGALNWHAEGRVERVTAGSVYFSLPWEKHGSVDEFEPGHTWHWVQIGIEGGLRRPRRHFRFHRDIGIPPAEARVISAVLTRTGRHCHRATPRLAWLLPAIVEELAKPGRFGDGYARALARLAVLELVRCIESDGEPPAGAAASEQRVGQVIAVLRERCDERWTLEAMAEACGLGRSRFATLCRRQTGDSPLGLVNRLRVDRAKALLRQADRNITDIAFACGFSSSQYFARVFRTFTGMDARSYRARHMRAVGS
ncbi:MAG: helix-turn-helix domain-containing protein [Opitutales bacterium]